MTEDAGSRHRARRADGSRQLPVMGGELSLDQIEELVGSLPGDFVAYWVLEDRMLVLAYSPSILISFGVTAEEFEFATAHDALDVVVENDRPYVFSTVEGKPVGTEQIDCEFRLLHRTQGFFWVHSRSRIIGTYQGGTVCLTDYLNADIEAEIYSRILDFADERVYVVDRRSFELLYANASAHRFARRFELPHRPVYRCYEYIKGRHERCADCPVDALETNETFDGDRFDESSGKWRHVSAKRAEWCGRNAMIQSISDVTEEKETAQALQRTSQLYELATRGADIMVWEYDSRTHCIDAPEHGMQHLEATDHIENVPDSVIDRFRDEDRERVIEFFRAVDEGQPVVTGDFWMRAVDNRPPYCIRYRYTNVLDDEGRPGKAYAVAQDVTVSKQEEELYDRLLRQLLISNTAAIGSFHMNLTRDTCSEGVSQTAYIGHFQESGTVDGFIETSGKIIVDEEELRYYREHFNRRALLESFEKGQTKVSYVFRDRMEDGSVHFIKTIVQMMRNPRTLDVEGVIYSYDVNDRMMHDQIIQHVTDVAFDFVALIDTNARTLEFWFVNEQTERIRPRQVLAYDTEFIPSAQIYIVAAERADCIAHARIEHLMARLEQQNTYAYTYAQPIEGGERRKQIEYSWFDRAGGLILAMKSDVTEIYLQEQAQRRQVEAALVAAREANEAKSVFLSSVSHDMRTPLNGILGFTGLALEETDAERKQEYLGKIETSGIILKELVDDTLDLSKIESGKYVLKPEICHSHQLLDEVDVAIRAAAEAKGVTFVEDWSRSRDGLVRIDRLAEQKVFLNLLSNAVKFTPVGGTVTIVVEDLAQPRYGCDARVIVSDTGVGMAASFLPKVFEPFTQEHAGGTGTGLGLSIAKRLVELMGGRIEVESEQGKGTIFTVYLPMDWLDEEEEAREQAQMAAPSRVGLTGKCILLVEDNAMNTEIARTLLEQRGAHVLTAADGQQGVAIFTASKPDAIDAVLMDIRMPVMDGYEATRAIRALDRADARRVPIVAMTADAYAEDVQRSRDAGMDAHVAKPIEPDRLFLMLDRLCGRES